MYNIEFNYRYRDAANYKNYNCVIFAPPEKIDFNDKLADMINILNEKKESIILKKLEYDIRNILEDKNYFIINGEIDIPELFFDDHNIENDNDHEYHEFDGLFFTDKEVTDYQNRNIIEFIKILKRNSNLWKGF